MGSVTRAERSKLKLSMSPPLSSLTSFLSMNFCRAKNHGFQPRGRKPLLSGEVCDQVYDKVTQDAMSLDAVSANGIQGLKEIMQEKAQLAAKNPHAPVAITDLSDRTALSYAQGLNLRNNACDTKNTGRANAFNDLRNHICQAAGNEVLFQLAHLYLIGASDDVGILLNGWDDNNKRAWSTLEANRWLQEQGLSLSTTGEKRQRRVVKMNNTTFYPSPPNPTGLNCSVLKLADRNFPDPPEIYKLDDGMYVILHHPETCKVNLAFVQYTQCIVPEAMALR